ncbi:MAG TPA: DUF4097 family beta strand repeat-containing protein [Candidatus Elarobacter sp.]|jgi:hypothetical protein|nr:DUF4097 family beta strand repeat-containing protein [Candidatus Elarobacter sp.]
MISRSTLIGALVVVELAIVGAAARAVAGDPGPASPAPFGFGPGAPRESSHRLDRTFATGLAPHVVIDVHDVDVTVRGENAVTVHASETLQRSGYVSGDVPALSAEQTPDGVRFSTPADHHVHVFIGHYSHDLQLAVPAGARVDVVGGGVVDASGLRAKLIAHVPSGAIRVHDHRGDVDVSTGKGWITMNDVQGDDIAANTRDGRIYLTRVGGERLNAFSSSGRIVGVDVRAVNGALTTRDGRVILSFTGNSDATVTAHTEDGNVKVTGLTTSDTADDRAVLHLGDGRGRFAVSTDSGPIVITPGASV